MIAILVFVGLVATSTTATPQYQYLDAPAEGQASYATPSEAEFRTARADAGRRHFAILRDDRDFHEDGNYAFEYETENGILRSAAGSPIDGADGALRQVGHFSYPMDNGDTFELKYVADENGYQPESRFLPVAPAFPHPIPEFVLRQIAKAEEEKRQAALRANERVSYVEPSPSVVRNAYEAVSEPRQSYGAPQRRF